MIVFGWLADNYGRVPTIMASNILTLVTGLVTPFAPEYVSFLVLRFTMGLAFNTFFTSPYILGNGCQTNLLTSSNLDVSVRVRCCRQEDAGW